MIVTPPPAPNMQAKDSSESIIVPDYAGGGIVNLMSSLIRARGGTSDLPEATLLAAGEIEDAQHLVLIIIDALGDDWLTRHAPDGWLAQQRIGTLTSVFPSTTAAAVGSFLTGVAPAQHAITGWFTWLRELGCLMKTLPGQPRAGGQGDWAMVKDLRTLFPCPPVFTRMQTASSLISPKSIAHSAFNRAHCGPALPRTFTRLGEFFDQIERAVRYAREPSYIHAYWPELDHIGHHHGIDSAKAVEHLQFIERGLATLAKRLAGRNTRLLVTADHGQLDCPATDQTELSDHPALADLLRMPLCGEPRAAFCYTAGGALEAFLAAADAHLGARFTAVRAADLLAQGYFGPGQPHPELKHRIGDAILLGRGACILRDHLPTETPFVPVGVHGGLSRAEMLVPLCYARL